MRARALLVAFALVSCAPAGSAAFLDEQWRLCQDSVIPAQRIGACGEVIAAASTPPERRAQALVQRGLQRAAQAQQVRAISDFGRALRIDPALIDAHIERGVVHQARGAIYEALADFEAALALDPSSMRAASLREDALVAAEGVEPGELGRLSLLIENDPGNPSLWNNRCWWRAVNGQELEIALADCNEALRLDPGNPNFLDSRGLVHLKRADFAAALVDYDAAVAADPSNGHFLFGRGVSRLRLARTAEGQADLAAAERLEPGISARYAEYGVAP
ncbi:MAG: hypothetical protein JNM59_07465 [Hyphomonadaceae bacterium]|nr:hypothetical protein [Hyphomonadaceae bacterium]